MSTDYCVGIDLGTTNTLCAVWVRGEAGPRILRVTQPTGDFTAEQFSREDDLLPSVVTVLKEGVFVGAAAKYIARTGSERTIPSIKRHMGTHWNRRIGDTDWTPEMVSGCILKAVRRELVPPLGRFDGEPRRVVITVPASFGTEQRRATLRAAHLAGFDPDPEKTLLFDEPTAALLHHLQHEGGIDKLPNGHRMMMIDIGGGTLDVSLMRLERRAETVVADIQGRSRFNELAGDDFDLNLAGFLLARFEEQCGSVQQGCTDHDRRQLFHEMLIQAEKAKQELSARGEKAKREDRAKVRTQVVLEMTPQGKPWRYEMTLEDMARALEEFFPLSADRQSRESEYTFYRPIQQCLTSVGQITQPLEPEEVDAVYLTGGSSLLPMVPYMVRRFMMRPPVRLAAPLQAVALGAAWYAGMRESYAGRSLELRERLYDGLLLLTGSGQFRQLLHPWEEVPQVGCRRFPLGTVLELSKPERRIEVGLFLGSRPDDPNMAPLAQRRLDFKKVLPRRQPIELTVSIDHNRDVQFEFTTQFLGEQPRAEIEVSTFRGWEDEKGPARELPEVNQPIRGPLP
jgi:molecular chaperone DnaK